MAKIGILIDRLNIGGVEKTAINQVKALNALGFDATLLVLTRRAVVEGAFPDLLQDLPIAYLEDFLPSFCRFSFKIPIAAFFSFFHISYPFLLPFFIPTKEYDYIISHSSYTTFSAITLRIFRKIPYSIYFSVPIYFILTRVFPNNIHNVDLRL